MNFGKQLKEGVITNNPVLVQILGMCPTLAVSTSLFNGIGMGICATLVLMCSNLVISVLRNIIPNKVRIAAFIVVIAGFVTCVDLLLKAFVPALSDSLGVFIPLIVVNCIILGRAEAFAYKNPPLASVVDGLTQGIGFTCALTILSVAREFLGSGTFGGGLIDAIDEFYERTITKAKTKALPIPASKIQFKKAQLGDFSGVIGACFLEDLSKNLKISKQIV